MKEVMTDQSVSGAIPISSLHTPGNSPFPHYTHQEIVHFLTTHTRK